MNQYLSTLMKFLSPRAFSRMLMFASLICRMEVITYLFPRVLIKITQGNVCKMLIGVWHLITHAVRIQVLALITAAAIATSRFL